MPSNQKASKKKTGNSKALDKESNLWRHEERTDSAPESCVPRRSLSVPALAANHTLTNLKVHLADHSRTSSSVRGVLSPKSNLRYTEPLSLASLKPIEDVNKVLGRTSKHAVVRESVEVETQTKKTLKPSDLQRASAVHSHPSSSKNIEFEEFLALRSSSSDTLLIDRRTNRQINDVSNTADSPSSFRRSTRIGKSKSQCSLECCDSHEGTLETRSKSRLTPQLRGGTPRSRRSAARTRPSIKQELQDDYGIDSDLLKSSMSRPLGDTIDTPKHLYGLDGNQEASSGDEEVSVDDEQNSNEAKTRKKSWCPRSPFCIISCLAIVLTLVIISSLFQPCPTKDSVFHWRGMHTLENDADTNQMDSSLREFQEKLEQLSLQVSGLRKSVTKNDSERFLDDETPMTKEKVSKLVEKAIKDNMEAAFDRYSADRLGIPDYALESDGGQIHGSHHSPTFNTGASRRVFGLSLWYESLPPRVIIQPDTKPGNCWAFEGQEGFVVIKLSKPIIPTMFTLEHIPLSLSTNGHGRIPTAPKDFSVWGWKDEAGDNRVCLGRFTYRSEGKSLQSFKMKEPQEAVYEYVELRVHTNHGHPVRTCIYRFRVHGYCSVPTEAPPTDCPNAKKINEDPQP